MHIKRGRERDERDAGRMFISAHDFDLFELHTTRRHFPLCSCALIGHCSQARSERCSSRAAVGHRASFVGAALTWSHVLGAAGRVQDGIALSC